MDDEQRFIALKQWADQLLARPNQPAAPRDPQAAHRSRLTPRSPMHLRLRLVSIDADELAPEQGAATVLVSKDISREGVGALSDVELAGRLFLTDAHHFAGLLLLDKVREPGKGDGLLEYGFAVLQRYPDAGADAAGIEPGVHEAPTADADTPAADRLSTFAAQLRQLSADERKRLLDMLNDPEAV